MVAAVLKWDGWGLPNSLHKCFSVAAWPLPQAKWNARGEKKMERDLEER